MANLFDIDGANLDRGFLNLQTAERPAEQAIKHALEEMWAIYEPYADPDFRHGFARDPDGRYWEMKLGCDLIGAGRRLLPVVERQRAGGQPDLCVLEEDKRVWIEAITPDDGAEGPDQIVRPIPLNEGGGVVAAPVRQAQLRISSALWTKTQKLEKYLADGIIDQNDVRLVAISGGRFGAFVPDEPISLITRTVFPIGDAYVTLNRETGEVVDEGFHLATHIERAAGDIPRTAFLDERFAHVSGVIWSRTGIGNLAVQPRPLTFVHNPMASVPMQQCWGLWDREYVAVRDEDSWRVHDLKDEGGVADRARRNERFME